MSLHSLAVFALSFRRIQNAKKHNEIDEPRKRSRSVTLFGEHDVKHRVNVGGTASRVVTATDQLILGLFPAALTTKGGTHSYSNLNDAKNGVDDRNDEDFDVFESEPPSSSSYIGRKHLAKKKLLDHAKRRQSLADSAVHILSRPSSISDEGASKIAAAENADVNAAIVDVAKNDSSPANKTNNGLLHIIPTNEVDKARSSPSPRRNLLAIFKRRTSELMESASHVESSPSTNLQTNNNVDEV